ncbi:MAG: divalent-cation tolerance protein CutA [Elusimicrobiaceae bacterium]
MPTEYSVTMITVPDQKTADAISGEVLNRKLAACVSLTPGVKSTYWWQGKLETSAEIIMLIKSRRNLFPELMLEIRNLHPYKTPEVITFNIEDGNTEYLDWIGASCAAPRKIQ